MAKVKMKFDAAAIKGWLLTHGEKLAFGAILLAFAMFAWGAVRREVLDAKNQPEELTKKASSVRSHVERSEWDAKREGIEVVEYVERAKREQVLAAALPTPLSAPLADPKSKREDPNLFGVEELRVASGYSIFELKGAAGRGAGGTSKAQPWVVITGLVPVQKQAQEYARVFQRAMGGDKKESTTPAYTDIIVYRADVTDGRGEPDFKPIPPSTFEQQWGAARPDIVNKDYTDDILTARLGPLAGQKAWDATVAHPKVPLAESAQGKAAPVAVAPKDQAPAPGKDQAPADAQQPTGRIRGAQTPAPASKPDANKNTAEVEIPYRLLRVFDYTVEPHKKYQYRVALVIKNPNFGVGQHMLVNPDSARKEEVQTAPSEPTDLVATPTGYRVLAVGLAAKSPRTDPVAKIMVSQIDAEAGIEPAGELEVSRGSVANFSANKLRVPDPAGGVREVSDVEIKTETLVLDIRGGRPLTAKKDALSPVEVLVLDKDGNLSVRNELADEGLVTQRRPPEESKSQDPLNGAPKARPRTRKR